MSKSLVKLYETPVNNHGCSGYEVTVQPVSEDTGIVVDGRSCSSCWQVGHDDNASPIQIGSIVKLPCFADLDWCIGAPVYIEKRFEEYPLFFRPEEQVTWGVATLECGHSHNELVNDIGVEVVGYTDDGDPVEREREPQPDCTLVGPSDLIILGHTHHSLL